MIQKSTKPTTKRMGKESNAKPKPKPVMAAIKSQSIYHILYTHGQTVTHASSDEETTYKNSFSLSLVMETTKLGSQKCGVEWRGGADRCGTQTRPWDGMSRVGNHRHRHRLRRHPHEE